MSIKGNDHTNKTKDKKNKTEALSLKLLNSGDFDIAAFNEETDKRLKESWRYYSIFLRAYREVDTGFLHSLNTIPEVQWTEKAEVIIPITGIVSAGKSSAVDAICEFPIIPVARQTTSICAVEIRRVHERGRERIEICAYTKDFKALEKKPLKVFAQQKISEALFRKLLDYAVLLVEKNILDVNDTLAFFYDQNGQIVLDRNNWRHVLFLLMILFDTYIHQDKQESPDLPANYREANDMRGELLEEMGIPADQSYGIRLYWDSPKIQDDMVIVDLPGIGSAAVSTKKQADHTTLVMNYINNAPSLIFLIDTRGVLDHESKELLDAYLATRTEQSSARIIFAMNKADTNEAPEEIETSINSFRAGYDKRFPSYSKYPVYAISAYAGEWRFLDNGILPENLHASRMIISMAKKYGFAVPERAMLEEKQMEAYRKEYPFQIASGSPFGSMSLERFIDEFVVEHVKRIRFLDIMENVKSHLQNIKTVTDAIELEKQMIDMAEQFGPECAAALSKGIRDTMDQIIDHLHQTFADTRTEMGKQLNKEVTNLNNITKQFEKDYQALNGVVNSKIRNCIAGMKKNNNGTIPIAAERLWWGKNKAGEENREKLLHMADIEIGKQLNFISFFQNGFTQLQKEFHEEEEIYDQLTGTLCRELDALPKATVQIMDQEFNRIVEDKFPWLKDNKSFASALQVAKESANKLLNDVCQEHKERLKKDETIKKGIKTTSERLSADFLKILTPYTNGTYGDKILDKITQFRWFAANTVNQTQLNEFLSKAFLEDFEYSLKDMFKKHFFGVKNQGDGHLYRMQQDIDAVEERYISEKATEDIKKQVIAACKVTELVIKDPRNVEQWNNVVTDAARKMKAFIECGEIVDTVLAAKNNIQPMAWAADDYGAAEVKAEETKTSIEHLLKHCKIISEETEV